VRKRKGSTEEKKEERIEAGAKAPVDKVSQPPDLKGLSVGSRPVEGQRSNVSRRAYTMGKRRREWRKKNKCDVNGLRTTRMAGSLVYFHGGKRGRRLK
jgi:hypothetical protein